MPKDDNKKPQTTEGENKDVQTPEDTTLGTAETETPQADEEMTAETVTEELSEEELMEEKPKKKDKIVNGAAPETSKEEHIIDEETHTMEETTPKQTTAKNFEEGPEQTAAKNSEEKPAKKDKKLDGIDPETMTDDLFEEEPLPPEAQAADENYKRFRSIYNKGILPEQFREVVGNAHRYDGHALASLLTGVYITENSSPEEHAAAFQKLIINGRNAEDFFGVKFSSQNGGNVKECMDVIAPKLRDIVEEIVTPIDKEGQSRQNYFVCVSEVGGIKPLLMNMNPPGSHQNFYAPSLDEEVTRCITRDEAREFLSKKYIEILQNRPFFAGDRFLANHSELAAAMEDPYKQKFNNQIENDYFDFKNEESRLMRTEKYKKEMLEARRTIVEDHKFLEEAAARIGNKVEPLPWQQVEDMAKGIVIEKLIKEENKETQYWKDADDFIANAREYERRINHLMQRDGFDIDKEADKLLEKNVKAYNKYMLEITNPKSPAGRIGKAARDYNDEAINFARILNNEVDISKLKGKSDAMSGKIASELSFSLDDLKDEKTFIKALFKKEPDINLDNIYIGDRSLREITGFAQGQNLSDCTYVMADKRGQLNFNKIKTEKFTAALEFFNKMAHPEMWDKDSSGKMIVPFAGIKAGNNITAINFTPGELPEAKPYVKPFSERRKLFSFERTINENKQAVEEYENSVAAINKRVSENEGIKFANKAMRIYLNTVNHRDLSLYEEEFVNNNHIATENSAVVRTNINTLTRANPSAAAPNIGLTAPTANHTNTMNGPNHNM